MEDVMRDMTNAFTMLQGNPEGDICWVDVNCMGGNLKTMFTSNKEYKGTE
jgi:hypothetical protein